MSSEWSAFQTDTILILQVSQSYGVKLLYPLVFVIL